MVIYSYHRYCLKWYQIASQRVNPIWWDKVLAPLRDLEVRATGGMVHLEKEHTRSSSEHIKENSLNISGSAEMNYLPSNVNLNVTSSLEGSKETGKGLDVGSFSRSFEIATRNSLEDVELETRALTEPLPTNQQVMNWYIIFYFPTFLQLNSCKGFTLCNIWISICRPIETINSMLLKNGLPSIRYFIQKGRFWGFVLVIQFTLGHVCKH